LISVENAGDRAVEGLPVSIVAMVQALCGNACSFRSCQAIGIRPVAEDNAEVEVNLASGRLVDE
jgi:hypothetical protein